MLKRAARQRNRHSIRSVLQSNVASLLLLTFLFVYSNWCYRGLKQRVHAQRLAQVHAGPHDDQQAAAVPAEVGGVLFAWGLDAHQRLGQPPGANTAFPQVSLPQEVSDIAASRHSLLVTRRGAVWSMGANDSAGGGGHGSKALAASGQLGRAGGWAPAVVSGALQGQVVRHVAAGRYHSVAVTEDGRVFTWGLNDWGQLGRPAAAAAEPAAQGTRAAGSGAAPRQGYLKDERLPRHKRALCQADAATRPAGAGPLRPRRVEAAAGGRWGLLASGPAGGGSSCTSGGACHDGAPGLVEALANVTVVAAKAGRYSTVVLTDVGQLWLWGYDGCATAGQLPQREEAWRPRLVQGQLQGQGVADFDVGYTFWLAATEDGKLYSCDTQDDGYAGTLPDKRKPNNAGQLGRTGSPHEPGRVLGALEGKTVVAVAAGREHAVVATAEGTVYSFGGSRAVLGRTGSNLEPDIVTGALAAQFVEHVAAGEYFSLAASATMVFGWGSNAYLGTGSGQDKDQTILLPTAVQGPLGTGEWTIHVLAAGYQHALAIAGQPGWVPSDKLASDAAAPAGAAQAGTVEVILTPQQQQERAQYQQALARSSSSTPELHAQLEQDAEAAQQQAAKTGGQDVATAPAQGLQDMPAPPTAAGAAGTLQADYHWSYLARQPAPSVLAAHQVWAAWKPSPWHDALAALSPDVFKLLPQQYNTEHKNPCWGGTGPELACLPYFNIIGVSKCGTTDLYQRLALYKTAILPATNKGPHFFDECPYPPKGACQAGPSGDFSAYINLFSRAADLIRSRPSAITGEASSNTFTSANGIYLRGFKGDRPVAEWAGAAGTNASMPALLREEQPYLRLILMLRDPVTRYYSAYHYYRWWLKEAQPPTPDDFHDHALKEMQEWKQCVAASSASACVRSFRQQQLIKGMYAEFLPDWLLHWPRQQLLILRYEDYTAALPQHLQAVLGFLGVPQPDTATLQAMVAAEVQNKKPYPPMRADTKALLRRFYAPFNAALAEALGDARWSWPDDAT